MSSKHVCFNLLHAQSEHEVSHIIDRCMEMSSPKNWCPISDTEHNFSTIGNQASDGGKAMTELMTNMVDAVLMKRAFQKQINPLGDNAPESMYEAVDQLVKNMHGGKLINLDDNDNWPRQFAQENLVIGISGKQSRKDTHSLPCFVFADNGEGQEPQKFKSTFLSLSEGNKKDIPFVQGKFNMGSTGVLSYSGRCWYKLIISRRYDKNSSWGWTLIRRRPGHLGKLPVAEYFVTFNREIPQFDEVQIFPLKSETGRLINEVMFESGTIVKLYDYDIGVRNISFDGARNALMENLIETILPFRLYDTRQSPSANKGHLRSMGVDSRQFHGMEYHILRHQEEDDLELWGDLASDGEHRLHVGDVRDADLGHISIWAIPFKILPKWLRGRSNINRIFHAINGQVHFKQTRAELTYCGLKALKDRVVIIVDASELHVAAHHDIWKGDREQVRKTSFGKHYLKEVQAAIRESDTLKQLQHRVRQEEQEKVANMENDALFQWLCQRDEVVGGLLQGTPPEFEIEAGGGSEGNGRTLERELTAKFSPTFVRFRKKKSVFRIKVGKGQRIMLETDARDDYFIRGQHRGEAYLIGELQGRALSRESLRRGNLNISVKPKSDSVEIGRKYTFAIGLHDETMVSDVKTDDAVVEIVGNDGGRRPHKPNTKPEEPVRDREGSVVSLPAYKLLTLDGREVNGETTLKGTNEMNDFSVDDGGTVVEGDDGVPIYKINYDNRYHQAYSEKLKSIAEKRALGDKFILGMRLLMFGLDREWKQQEDKKILTELDDRFMRIAARAAASTVLAVVVSVPNAIDTLVKQQ